ncbi:hypothetical protein BGZ60DRAFT_402431 [Tricladium varicosporioides]|nr:hypothetical protein BGZ60DRAFT_402431 [Hymenoscyphus varicosporioides]
MPGYMCFPKRDRKPIVLYARRVDILSIPKPPKIRKRTLTLPLPAKSSRKQMTSDQAQSILFKLPFEVRLVIWKFSIGGMTLRLTAQGGHLYQNTPYPPGWVPKYGMLSLLLACRRSYSEAIDLLYSSNVLRFGLCRGLVHLDWIFLPQRLQKISDIKIGWLFKRRLEVGSPMFKEWTSVWQGLIKFSGLRRLRVHLKISHDTDYWSQNEVEILEPLSHLTRPQVFELTLSWPAGPRGLPVGIYQVKRVSRL